MSIAFNEWDIIYPMEALRKARCSLSQEEFTKTAGLGWSTYQRWMAKEIEPKLTPSQIREICKILNTDPNSLIGYLNGELELHEIPIKCLQKS